MLWISRVDLFAIGLSRSKYVSQSIITIVKVISYQEAASTVLRHPGGELSVVRPKSRYRVLARYVDEECVNCSCVMATSSWVRMTRGMKED